MRTRIVLAQVTNHKFLIHNARLPSQHHKGPTIRKVVGVGGEGGKLILNKYSSYGLKKNSYKEFDNEKKFPSPP